MAYILSAAGSIAASIAREEPAKLTDIQECIFTRITTLITLLKDDVINQKVADESHIPKFTLAELVLGIKKDDLSRIIPEVPFAICHLPTNGDQSEVVTDGKADVVEDKPP